MTRVALLFPLVVLVLLSTPCFAVTCDSYKTKEKCTGMVDGTKKCSWEDTVCVTSSETIGEGMVGITSVEAPQETAEPLAPTNDTFCSLPPDDTAETGIACLAYIAVYYYNKTMDACVLYGYGGCGATENLFGSLEACEDAAATFCGFKKSTTSNTTVPTTSVPTTEEQSGMGMGSPSVPAVMETGMKSPSPVSSPLTTSSSNLVHPGATITAIVFAFLPRMLNMM